MPINAEPASTDLVVDDLWVITVCVRDADLCLSDAVTPVVTVTPPTGGAATPTVERLALGTYRAVHTPSAAGRYTAHVAATGYGAADLVAYVKAPTANGSLPTVQNCRDYVPDGLSSWDDDEVTDALAAETDAQRRACRVPASYPNDLAQALKRRVVRNLAMRGQPGVVVPGGDGSPSFVPTNDPEVRRLERPWRRVVLA